MSYSLSLTCCVYEIFILDSTSMTAKSLTLSMKLTHLAVSHILTLFHTNLTKSLKMYYLLARNYTTACTCTCTYMYVYMYVT